MSISYPEGMAHGISPDSKGLGVTKPKLDLRDKDLPTEDLRDIKTPLDLRDKDLPTGDLRDIKTPLDLRDKDTSENF